MGVLVLSWNGISILGYKMTAFINPLAQAYVAHGRTTHKEGEKCKVCEETMAEFEKWVDGRTNEELIKELKERKE